ncbi:unnamed protein product [Nesidiocoris tenuis]|uniref:Uncharacterized protein n=1 Tax=Nesidiocoris tenuis TaxID=355587 RepID=A0A6H5GRZ0_9HEMI|nr:unnamed protein product [Nesidiocoris tenuis]
MDRCDLIDHRHLPQGRIVILGLRFLGFLKILVKQCLRHPHFFEDFRTSSAPSRRSYNKVKFPTYKIQKLHSSNFFRIPTWKRAWRRSLIGGRVRKSVHNPRAITKRLGMPGSADRGYSPGTSAPIFAFSRFSSTPQLPFQRIPIPLPGVGPN